MTLSLTAVALPLWIKGLHTLQHILTVAEDHARSQGLDPDVEYPDARLIDDMRPLTFQIQNATKTVRQAVARLEGREDVPWADDEKTVGDLKKRLERTLEVVKGLDAGKVDARAGEVVDLALGPTIIKLTATESVLKHSIPNFFFHVQTAYAILRSKGVPLGKRDYIASFLA